MLGGAPAPAVAPGAKRPGGAPRVSLPLTVVPTVVALVAGLLMGGWRCPSRAHATAPAAAAGRTAAAAATGSTAHLKLPPDIRRLTINIGPNYTPVLPPADDNASAVLVVEANLGVANHLREEFQKSRFPSRFFVVSAAVAGAPIAPGSLANFHFYNREGQSSSLSPIQDAASDQDWASGSHNEAGTAPAVPGGVDFVPTVSLDSILRAVPPTVDIVVVKTDAQGHDLGIVRSASREQLRRVPLLLTEVYVNGIGSRRYQGVDNSVEAFETYMGSVGFRLENAAGLATIKARASPSEFDARWIRVHE